MWIFSIIQNASDPREPKITNLTVEVNHSKIDKTNSNHKAQMYILELQNWLQDANLREVGFLLCELCMSRFLEVGGICLTWVQKISCNYCAPPLCCPSKGKAGTTHSHLHSQPGAGKCYNAFAKWMCLPFLGLQSQSSIRKQLHIQKQVGWEWLQPEQKKRRIRHPGVTATQLLPGDAIQWWIGY